MYFVCCMGLYHAVVDLKYGASGANCTGAFIMGSIGAVGWALAAQAKRPSVKWLSLRYFA